MRTVIPKLRPLIHNWLRKRKIRKMKKRVLMNNDASLFDQPLNLSHALTLVKGLHTRGVAMDIAPKHQLSAFSERSGPSRKPGPIYIKQGDDYVFNDEDWKVGFRGRVIPRKK